MVKLGVNNSVNMDMKRVGVRLMDGGGSRIRRPTSHPSNRPQQGSGDSKRPEASEMKSSKDSKMKSSKDRDSDNHEMLKTGVFMVAAVSAFLIYRMR